MPRLLMVLLRRRRFWLALLLTVWLLCSGQALAVGSSALGQRAIKAVKVDPQNPSRQVTLLSGGRQLESTITARAIETPAPDQFTPIERFQQVFRGGAIPYFNEVETTTAYRLEQAGITADQVTAVYLSPQEPDFLKAPNQPIALYRYQLNLSPTEDL